MSHVMSEAQAVQFFEEIATYLRIENAELTADETVDVAMTKMKGAYFSQVGTVIKWQITMLQLIHADENQANPSRRPPPGVDVHAPGYDRANEWPTDANRVIDEEVEMRALASMLFRHALQLPIRKAHVIEVRIPFLLGFVAKLVDKDNNEIPGALEGLQRVPGMSRLASETCLCIWPERSPIEVASGQAYESWQRLLPECDSCASSKMTFRAVPTFATPGPYVQVLAFLSLFSSLGVSRARRPVVCICGPH
ncbi:hypothetical protein VTL71DRAFT_12238 [Oculimacula yallundae]|uniref:Uncharacterized protein n=1 Tax=Oculimacula yallundae TaxID=86028 RepID=A0ABR4CSQ9_9HELO